jgi:hypothetical protein
LISHSCKGFARLLPAILIVIGIASIVAPAVLAQGDQGEITGTIHDATAAIIPSVEVTVTNEKTGERELRSQTNAAITSSQR